jgi:hydroxyacylglutathione hydrolase
MKIEENIYAYLWQSQYENNCNTYVIQGDKTILIDPGHLAHVESLFKKMEKDGIAPDKVDLVMITHAHPDHFEGLAAFMDKGAKIAIAGDEEDYLRGNGKALFEMMGQDVPEFRIDLHLKEGDLQVGEERFQIYLTPGHSPGSLSIYWPERKVLFTGDLIFYGGVGRTDFPGGDSRMLKESIEKLALLDTQLLLPGHGDIVKGSEKVARNYEFIRESFFSYL